MTDEAIFGFDLLDGRYATSDRYDDTLQQIITHRLAEYYHRAKRLLAEHRSLLDGIAEALAKKRYLISDDFKRIKADCVAYTDKRKADRVRSGCDLRF